jgi:hypothetical protein
MEEGHVMRKKILIGMTAVLFAIPAISIAADRFNDVPSTHSFHEDISWLADRGVTRGCNPPANDEFCPDDSVTRGQMAAFLRRFANTSESRLVGSEGADAILGNNTWVALDSLTIHAPADGGALSLGGSAIFFIANDTDDGAVGLLEVTVDQGCADASNGIPAFWSTLLNVGGDSAAAVGSLPVSQGAHTVRLCAFASHLNSSERTQSIESRVTALWAPHGQVEALGGNTSDASMTKSEMLDRIREMVSRAGE